MWHCPWNEDGKSRPLTGRGIDLDFVVEKRREAANDRQAEAHALFAMTLCGVNLIELVEYVFAVRRGYAYAGIADVDRKKGSAAAHAEHGSAALGRSHRV